MPRDGNFWEIWQILFLKWLCFFHEWVGQLWAQIWALWAVIYKNRPRVTSEFPVPPWWSISKRSKYFRRLPRLSNDAILFFFSFTGIHLPIAGYCRLILQLSTQPRSKNHFSWLGFLFDSLIFDRMLMQSITTWGGSHIAIKIYKQLHTGLFWARGASKISKKKGHRWKYDTMFHFFDKNWMKYVRPCMAEEIKYICENVVLLFLTTTDSEACQ